MIDIHSHVLPGIDDGSKNMAMSLEILRGLESQGITDLICTPHYIPETKQTSSFAANKKIFQELKKAAAKEGVKINLHLGNEIYIDLKIAKLLSAKKITSLNQTKYLLVELPMSGEFEQYEDILLELKQKGWKVILAHPERYHSFQKDINKALSLQTNDILLQCNLGSIIGQYGAKAKKAAKKLIKEKAVFCFGTDIHRPRGYSEIKKAQNKLKRYYTDSEISALLVQNPQKIVK